MRLERVLFPENDEPSWGKKTSKSSSSRHGKTKVRKGKRLQQKHRVGKREESVSVLMNLNENKPSKRKKKISKSSKQRSVPYADSQIHDTGELQSSSALNDDSKSSINFVSEPLLHSLGATDSLMFLGGIGGNVGSKIKKAVSRRKSKPRRHKRERVSKRARDFVTKVAEGNDSHSILLDKRSSGSQQDNSEKTKKGDTENRFMDAENSGKSSQQQLLQQKSRRPKRQRDYNENTSKLQDTQASHEAKSGGEALIKRLDYPTTDKSTKRKGGKVVKFVGEHSERRRGKRSKGKLHVSSGGLNGLCGLENHGFSFPVPDPVLNRSVLVSPLSVESIDSNRYKDRGTRCKRTKKSTRKRSDGVNSEINNNAVRDRKNKKEAKQSSAESESDRSSFGETKNAEALSKKHDENDTSNRTIPKKSLQQFESEPESVCASFSPESSESLYKQDGSRLLSQVSSAQHENMPINRCASNSSRETTKKTSRAKSSVPTKSRIANSRRLDSLSQSWYLDSSSNTSLRREALNEGAGAYVLDVEEADMSWVQKQRHRVAERSKTDEDSNCDCQMSTQKEAPLDISDNHRENVERKPISTRKQGPSNSSCDKENVEKKRTRKKKSTTKKKNPPARRFGRSIEGNVKPSEQSAEAQNSGNLAEIEEKAAVEPTPLRRSARKRRSSSSNDEKGNSEEKGASGLRRSRRSIERPRRFGVYEGDDDSTYVPTPLTRTTSKKGLSGKTSAEKKIPKPTKIEEEQQGAEEAKINTNRWNENEVLLLREAQKVVDPKSYSYWQDVADLVGVRSAEECQEKWFSLAKTPNIRQKKKKEKEDSKQILNSPQDDDIFDATPMKALFARSSGDEDPLLGSMGFLSQLNLGSAVKVDRVAIEDESSTLATARGYKSYIRDMKREIHAKNKNTKPRLPKKGSSKVKTLREQAEEGDIELKGRLSPGGTLHMTSNVDEDIDDGYDIDEE